jgi:hypothetical protein
MKLWKMNGAGNAFAIFDARSTPFSPSVEQIRQIASDLKADQVIALERDATKDVFMRIWNSDGGQVYACGNASRCVGHLILAETGKDRITIQTEADMLKAFRAEGGLITVDMGSPLMGWADIPLSEKMDVRGVDLKIGPIDKPILAHEEVLELSRGGVMHEGLVSLVLGLGGMPAAAEEVLIGRDIALAEVTGGRLHAMHVSTGGGVALIREAKRRGIRVTAEACPHHFTLTDESLRGFDANHKMSPPLRTAADVEAILAMMRPESTPPSLSDFVLALTFSTKSSFE